MPDDQLDQGVEVSGTVCIGFEGLTVAEANRGALELADSLRRADRTIATGIRKDDTETQDLGSTIVAVLGTGAVVALAKGVAAFAAKFGDRVIIRTADGEVIARGAAARDVAKVAPSIIKAMRSQKS